MSDVMEAKHLNSSGGTYDDTETVIRWAPGSNAVWVTVECLPFLQWWSLPDAGKMRKWVDDLLKDQGVKRDGARVEINGGPLNKWRFLYSVTKL